MPRTGEHFIHERLGEVEFYQYNDVKGRVEVFDKYGIQRDLPIQEFEKCQSLGDDSKIF